jgi:hypothetical protein
LHERTAQLKNNVDFGFICGFNIAILSALFATLFSRLLGRWRSAIAALACIAVYTLLVGGEPPVARTAILGGLSVFAQQLGCRKGGVNILALDAALLSIGRSAYITFSYIYGSASVVRRTQYLALCSKAVSPRRQPAILTLMCHRKIVISFFILGWG